MFPWLTAAWQPTQGRRARALTVWLICSALAVPGCASQQAPTSPDSGAVSPGTWGGPHIAFVVTNTAVTVEFDCAHGQIDGAVQLDARGQFDAVGTFVLEHAGPARPNEVPDTHPARYSGSASASVMSLTVTVTDSGQNIGTYSLTLGQPGQIVKCL